MEKSPVENRPAVLLVDDDQSYWLMYEMMLRKHIPQAQLYSAKDGIPALAQLPEIVLQHPKVVVLTDLNMPGMNGDELVRKIRNSSDPHINTLSIIMHTANSSPQTKAEFAKLKKDTGPLSHLELMFKPIPISALLAAMSRMLALNDPPQQ